MQRWDRLVDRYMEEFAARGICPEHVGYVGRELDRWGAWLKRRRPRPQLQEVDAELIVRYIRYRNTFRAKATLSSNVSILRGMGEFLLREGVWASNPLRWIRGPKLDPRARLPKRLGPQLMKRLWEGAAASRYRHHRYLWISILGVLYGSGIRRGELSRLDVDDWDRDLGLLQVDGRKTGEQRRVPVPPMVWHCLETYLPQRQNQLERVGSVGESALFVNKDGMRLTSLGISRGIHRLARRCGVPLVSLHQFRHTCASDLLEEGLSLPAVKQLLGHRAISTTVRYLHISDPQRCQAISRHPLNDWLASGHEEELQP